MGKNSVIDKKNGIFDRINKKLLHELQNNADIPLEELSAKIGLSRNACWRRVKQLEQAGVIKHRVALLEPAMINLALSVFIAVRTTQHNPDWLKRFKSAVQDIPEILGVYRTSGELDYLLYARVPDVAAYDALYQRLIKRIELADVSSSFVMEEIKQTTELPLDYS